MPNWATRMDGSISRHPLAIGALIGVLWGVTQFLALGDGVTAVAVGALMGVATSTVRVAKASGHRP